jgi:hypothetical protein
MQAAALRGEAVDPGACKWNIPPDTRNVVPINKIYDVGPANLIVKSQESQITDYEICSVDNKKTSSGSIQGCWRYAANLMGARVHLRDAAELWRVRRPRWTAVSGRLFSHPRGHARRSMRPERSRSALQPQRRPGVPARRNRPALPVVLATPVSAVRPTRTAC